MGSRTGEVELEDFGGGGEDGEPALGFGFGDGAAVVLADDGRGVAGFFGDLGDAFGEGEAVADVGFTEDVAGFVAGGGEAGGAFGVGEGVAGGDGGDGAVAAEMRGEPGGEVFGDGDDAVAPGFGDAFGDVEVTFVEVDVAPVEFEGFGVAEAGEGLEGEEGDEGFVGVAVGFGVLAGGEEAEELFWGEDFDFGGFGFGGGDVFEFVPGAGEVVFGAGEAGELGEGGAVMVARAGRVGGVAVGEAGDPGAEVGGGEGVQGDGEGGGEFLELTFEVGLVVRGDGAGFLGGEGGDEFGDVEGAEAAGAVLFVPVHEGVEGDAQGLEALLAVGVFGGGVFDGLAGGVEVFQGAEVAGGVQRGELADGGVGVGGAGGVVLGEGVGGFPGGAGGAAAAAVEVAPLDGVGAGVAAEDFDEGVAGGEEFGGPAVAPGVGGGGAHFLRPGLRISVGVGRG